MLQSLMNSTLKWSVCYFSYFAEWSIIQCVWIQFFSIFVDFVINWILIKPKLLDQFVTSANPLLQPKYSISCECATISVQYLPFSGFFRYFFCFRLNNSRWCNSNWKWIKFKEKTLIQYIFLWKIIEYEV